MENIIIRTDCMFKSKTLNTATKGIAKAAVNINEGRKAICSILARVEEGKAYTEDGFKSLAEYADFIGLGKSSIHKMENAGRLINSENPIVKDFAENTDFSKLAIVSSLGEEAIESSIKSGALKPTMTQDEIRKFKDSVIPADVSGKEKVLPKFEVWLVKGNGDSVHYDSIELENVQEISNHVKVGAFDLCGDKWTVYADTIDGSMVRVRTEKVKKETKVKKPVVKDITKMSYEEIMAYMQGMVDKG